MQPVLDDRKFSRHPFGRAMRSIAVIQRAFLSLVHFFLFYYDEKSGLSAEGVAKHTTAMCRRSIGEDPFNADNQEERNEHDKKLISITKS